MRVRYHFLKIVILLTSFFFLSACGGGGGGGSTPAAPTLSSIEISPGTANLEVGDILALTATGNYSDGSNRDLTSNVSWSFTNAGGMVSISDTGQVLGVQAGNVIVTASLAGVSGDSAITVNANLRTLDTISIAPASATIQVNAMQIFTATGNYSDGSTLDISQYVSWSSSDTAIATIDAQGVASGISQGAVTIEAALAAITANASLQVNGVAPALDSITLAPASPSININATQNFTATGNYSDGSTQDLTAIVNWLSSDNSIATINAAGVALGINAGGVTISAELNGVTGTASLTVTANAPSLDSITITPAVTSVIQGGTTNFTATGNYSDGSTQDLTGSVNWLSSDTNLATINANGVATGVTPGAVTITASMAGVTDTAILNVSATLVSIDITPSGPNTILLGETIAYTAIGNYSDGSTVNLTNFRALNWVSSDDTIASIGADGIATGLAIGTVNINATLAGITSTTVNLTVEAELTSISISPSVPVLKVLTGRQFTATGSYSDGTTQDITSSVTWQSSDTAVALVNTTGTVGALSVGRSTISAQLNGKTARVTARITQNNLISIAVSPFTATLDVGDTRNFTATAFFDGGGSSSDYTPIVNWISSDETVASIDNNGVVTGVGIGNVTITAEVNGGEIADTANVRVIGLLSIDIEDAGVPVTVLDMRYATAKRLVAMGNYSNLTRRDITDQADWQSSNNNRVSVLNSGANKGLTSAVDIGPAIVSASLNSVTGDTEVTVLGAISLRRTGQVNCYDRFGLSVNCNNRGQDGDLRNGVSITGRFGFAEFAQGCITDNLSGLTWRVNANGNLINLDWQGALDFVALINAGSNNCGHTDWRLPNTRELLSLVNFNEADSTVWLENIGFTNVDPNGYWTSTTNPNNPAQAYVVNMQTGVSLLRAKTNAISKVWLVRGGR